MKLGTEKNKILILAGLTVIVVIVLWINVFSGPSASPRPDTPRPPQNARATAAPTRLSAVRRASGTRESMGEFRPPFKSSKLENQPNLTTIDPTLRLDLLANVQNTTLEGGSRNLFQFEKAPEPPAPPLPKNPAKIAINNPAGGGPGQPPVTAPPPGPAPPPPITLKYYGYSMRRGEGRKQAFFLDGDDILVAYEGQMIEKRYKLVRIGVNSVDVEDVDRKRTQTIPLQQEPAAG